MRARLRPIYAALVGRNDRVPAVPALGRWFCMVNCGDIANIDEYASNLLG
ncbi:hypothetical protein [Thermincola potens]|nr:hypothetical protein [Thermincola potens]